MTSPALCAHEERPELMTSLNCFHAEGTEFTNVERGMVGIGMVDNNVFHWLLLKTNQTAAHGGYRPLVYSRMCSER